jgi:threonine dehydrogenase-like Zn-dependent dehydrogenase
MDALVWHGGPRLEMEDIAEPAVADGQVRFDVALAGICGSDLHPYRGHAGPRVPPLVLGHEAVGTSPQRDGRVVLFPITSCGRCDACARGEVNLCATRGLVGLDRQGVFAERVAVAGDALIPIPAGLADEAAVLTEPLATPLSALRASGAAAGMRVVVLGGGPIGLLTVYACAALGIDAELVEPLTHRRELARELGASATHASGDALAAGSFDLAVDAVGIAPTWAPAIRAVRMGGTVTIVGLGASEGPLAVGDLVRRGIAVRGHYAYTRADFQAALQLLAERPLPLHWLSALPLRDGAEGFRRLVEEPDGHIKMLLAP